MSGPPAAQVEPRGFSVRGDGPEIRGEEIGPERPRPGTPPLVLLHGLTATRRYVVHRSRVLPREGFRTVAYDARGHGASAPATAGSGYGYEDLAADLARLLDERVGEGRAVLAGHSMGAQTLASYALGAHDRLAGIVVIGPVITGGPPSPEALESWDRLADGLERGGVEGFIAAYADGLDPDWRETVLRFTRERLKAHRHPDAVVRALREVPRSIAFGDLAELESLDLPALVVASRDVADPGHPYAVAEAWAERLPASRLVSEAEGESPLAWQGGRLSREIAAFCREDAVRERAS